MVRAATTEQATSKLVVGNSYVTLHDYNNDGLASEVIAVLNGDPTERLTITTGTVVMRLTSSVAQFQNIQFSSNQIDSVGLNQDLKITANGAGQIIFERPTLFSIGNVPNPSRGQTGLYVATPAGGGSGVFFKATDVDGSVRQDEFISRKKALIFSIIFG